MTENRDVTVYKSSPTGRRFHRGKMRDEEVRLIKGPVGSGKSVACVNEIFNLMCMQWPVKGVRKSRWAVIRKTVPELKTTTIQTWLDWFGSVTTMKYTSPIEGHVKVPLEDGTIVESTIYFISIPDEGSEEKLKSLELTCGFINEASEISQSAFDLLTTRIKRYPAKRDGGANFYGIIMDTNSFDDNHWLHDVFYKDLPKRYALYDQPPALIRQVKDGKIEYIAHPDAENIKNHATGIDYYLDMVHGKSMSFVDVIIMNQIGSTKEGNYLYAKDYSPAIGGNRTEIEFNNNLPALHWSHDQNYDPMSSVIIQEVNGIDVAVDEIVLGGTDAKGVAQEFVERYRGYRGEIKIYGDRYGRQGEKYDDVDSYYEIIIDYLADHGFHRVSLHALSKNPPIKDCQDSLKGRLQDAHGQRHFLVNEKMCPVLDQGLRKVQTKPGSSFKEIEEHFQHITTAARYFTWTKYKADKDKGEGGYIGVVR